MPMLTAPVETIPLRTDDTGTIRVGQTRVTLDSVADSWQQGATPEQIVNQFPTLMLPDVYAVLAWMLRHPAETEAYLTARQAQADQLRAETERRCPPEGFKAKLLARSQGRV